MAGGKMFPRGYNNDCSLFSLNFFYHKIYILYLDKY